MARTGRAVGGGWGRRGAGREWLRWREEERAAEAAGVEGGTRERRAPISAIEGGGRREKRGARKCLGELAKGRGVVVELLFPPRALWV